MGEPARQVGGGEPAGRGRVVLVGRTGLDSTLRRDAGIDLVRVRTALEALGEAVNPPEVSAAPLACIAVAAEADPPPPHGAAFAAAVREAAPAVRLVLVCDEPGRGAGSYDAVVASTMPFHALKAVLLAQPAEVPVRGAPAAAPIPAPPQPAPDAAPLSADEDPQSALLRAVLAGRDVMLPALEQARRQAGAPDAVFVPAEQAASIDPAAARAPVAHRATTIGWLVSRRAEAETLAPAAALLAQWLALAEQQKELRRAALSDDLTGAYNRRYFERYLRAAIDQAGRDRRTVLLLLFDIDNFKRFNDAHGHAAGDEILRETIRLLTSCVRPTDRVCRIGGDEFAVVFYDPSAPRDPASRPPQDAAAMARRFQQQVGARRFPKLGLEAPGSLTISGGLACYPWDGRTAEELIRRADELALQSKRQGKNAIAFGPGVTGGGESGPAR